MHKIYFLVAASLLASCGVAVKSTTLTSSNGTFELTVSKIKTFDSAINQNGTKYTPSDKNAMYLDFDFVVKNVSSKTVAVRFYYEAGIEFDENQYYVTQAEPYVLGSAFDAVTFPESLAPNETYSYNFCITCFKDFGYATFFFAKNYSSVKDRACSVKITSDLPSHYMVYDQRTGAEATSSSSISE